MRISVSILAAVLVLGYGVNDALAQESQSSLYVPLIGITSVPRPLALPEGAGVVTYRYAVKSFIKEVPLTDVYVVDDTCNPVTFVEGDDNNDDTLDYSETWRYVCTTTLYETTESTAMAVGSAHDITTTHKAHATVVVGSDIPPPLVSIINITKIAYPLSLPSEGGTITFTYRVNNPGIVPLSNVVITDDKCSAMSGKLGDTNGNNLLDVQEVWMYTCTTNLMRTTTNTAVVTAFANGLQAVGEASLTVNVDTSSAETVPEFPAQAIPSFPETGEVSDAKIATWAFLSGILVALIAFFVLTQKRKVGKKK